MDLDKYFIMKNGGRLRRGVINLNNAIHLFYKNDAVGGVLHGCLRKLAVDMQIWLAML